MEAQKSKSISCENISEGDSHDESVLVIESVKGNENRNQLIQGYEIEFGAISHEGPEETVKHRTLESDQNLLTDTAGTVTYNKTVKEPAGKVNSEVQHEAGVLDDKNTGNNRNTDVIQETDSVPNEAVQQAKFEEDGLMPQTSGFVEGKVDNYIWQKDELFVSNDGLKKLGQYELFPTLKNIMVTKLPTEVSETSGRRTYPVRSRTFMATLSSWTDASARSIDIESDTREVGLLITYSNLFWGFYLICCAFSIFEMYCVKLWPYCTWYYPWCVASREQPQAIGLALLDHLTRIIGRITMVSISALFLTQSRCTMNWVAENAPLWVDVEDIGAANRNLYWYIGVFFCGVPTILHVFSAFAPMIDGYEVRLIPEFQRGDNQEQPQFINPINNPITNTTNWEVVLSGNDCYRLTAMSIIFFLIIPLSLSKTLRRFSWSSAVKLHWLGAMWYASDVLLKFHPRSYVFNAPFMILYLLDVLCGIYWYRTVRNVKIVNKLIIDSNYAVLFLKLDVPAVMNVGDTYWFSAEQFPDCTYRLEHSHPFTCWRNDKRNPYCYPLTREHQALDHESHKFKMIKKDDKLHVKREVTTFAGVGGKIDIIDSEKRAASWDLAIIMATQHPSVTHGCFSKNCLKRNMIPWTTQVLSEEVQTLKCHGPYRTGFGVLGLEDYSNTPPLVMISSGAGVGYVFTFHQWLLANNKPLSNTVHIYYTTNSKSLFQFVTDSLCKYHFDNLHVSAHLTRVNQDTITYENESPLKSRQILFGRLSLAEIINNCPRHTEVFFVGSAVLNNIARKLCKENNLRFTGGHVFN